MNSSIAVPALATIAGLTGAILGVSLTSVRSRTRIALPLSAGVLLGVALFGLIPELAGELGWPVSLLLFAGGYGLLFLLSRFYEVCPSCSHTHDHDHCESELHGFAAPLIVAAALHSFLDGWSVATVQLAAPLGLRIAVPLAVCLHKLPEGIALGGILEAAVKTRRTALLWCIVAEGATFIGGAAGLAMAPHLGTKWITYPLGLAAGWLTFLGAHAVHEEWRRRGPRLAFLSAGAGIVGAAVIQRGAEAFWR